MLRRGSQFNAVVGKIAGYTMASVPLARLVVAMPCAHKFVRFGKFKRHNS